MNSNEPSYLYFDIETVPVIFAGWRLGKQDVNYKQVLKRGQVLCISWAWGDGKVQHDLFDLSLYDWYEKDDYADFELVSKFSELAQDATVVIGHNAKQFDVAFLRSRLVKYNLPDFNPILIDDTYLATKDIGFLSHKLDDLGDYLGIGHKAEHGDGMEWWIDVMRGNRKILNRMVHYCDVDVVRLRQLYKRVLPYIKPKLNLAVFHGKPGICPDCGASADNLIKRGYNYAKASKNQRYQCKVCGWWGHDGKNLLTEKNYNR